MADEKADENGYWKDGVYYAHRKPFQLNFFAYEELPNADKDKQELIALYDKLIQNTDVSEYRGECGKVYDKPYGGGYTHIEVLPEFKGQKLSDLVLAYVHGLRPSMIRVTKGVYTLDARTNRVTIDVDANDVIQKITQEISVAYGSGDHVQRVRDCVTRGIDPTQLPGRGGVIGHTAGLARVDFE